MWIELTNVGKRFNREWIFRAINAHFEQGQSYVVVGPNGSGKSTLLQVIAGAILASEGEVSFCDADSKPIPPEEHFRRVNMAAPYLELIEEFTLQELIAFHVRFKPLQGLTTVSELIETIGLEAATHKLIRNFSSGMKQRLKLGLAFCTQADVIVLDEPTSNLDVTGQAWYLKMVEQFGVSKILLIGSNEPKEYSFCEHLIKITDYKV